MLSPGALEVLFDHAEIVVEGGEEVGTRQPGQPRVFGTVMVSIDLASCASHVREPVDAATARRVAELMEGEPRVRQRLQGLAARELARVAGVDPEALVASQVAVEIAVRVEGTVLLIDVDAMATLATRRG